MVRKKKLGINNDHAICFYLFARISFFTLERLTCNLRYIFIIICIFQQKYLIKHNLVAKYIHDFCMLSLDK